MCVKSNDVIEQKYNVNVEKLSSGQEFKSYRDLCNFLNQSVLGGSSKQSQLKEWKRYFEYHKDGNRIIIDNVYDCPLAKEDGRLMNGTELYTQLIESLLLGMMDATLVNDDKPYEFNMQQMVLMFGMANPIYYKDDTKQKLMDAGYNQFHITDFYNRSGSKFVSVIENALNNMEKRRIIMWSKKNKILENGSWRTATDIESNQILSVEKEILHQMGSTSITQIIYSGQSYNYYTKLNIRLKQEYGWDSAYRFYEIWGARKRIEIEKETLQDNNKIYQLELNDRIVKAIKQQAVDRADKSEKILLDVITNNSSSNQFTLPSDYVDVQNELAEHLLRIAGSENK